MKRILHSCQWPELWLVRTVKTQPRKRNRELLWKDSSEVRPGIEA